MSKNVDAVLKIADSLLAEVPTSLRVRLPELERDGKRVVRELSLRQVGDNWLATYGERSGAVSKPFKPVCSAVCDGPIEAVLWADRQGHASAE